MNCSKLLRLLAAAAVGAFLWSGLAAAQDYPRRPIHMVVPFPPGGGTDVIGRLLAEKISANWGQQVVVENRPGAAGLVGAGVVARAAPDGHTVLMTALGGVNMDTLGGFAPVILISEPPSVVVAHPAVKANTMAELIEHIRANPGKLNFGSSGLGSLSHLSGELLKSMAGLDVVHVPYKGIGQVIGELLGNQIQFVAAPLPAVHGHISNGKLKALAVTGSKRFAPLPDVPTIAESGVPGYDAMNWFGMLAPAAVDRGIVQKLNAEVNRVLKLPEVQERLQSLGADPAGGTPEDFDRFIRADTAKWAKVIKDAGIQLK